MIGVIWFIGFLISLGDFIIVRAGKLSERYTGYGGGERLFNFVVGSFMISLMWPLSIPGFLLYELGKKLGKKNA